MYSMRTTSAFLLKSFQRMAGVFNIISTMYAVKMYEKYGDQAIKVVSQNLYQQAVDT